MTWTLGIYDITKEVVKISSDNFWASEIIRTSTNLILFDDSVYDEMNISVSQIRQMFMISW